MEPPRVDLDLLAVGSTCHFGALVGNGGWRRQYFPAIVALIRHPDRGTILFDTGYGTKVLRMRGLAAAFYRRLVPVHLSAAERIDKALAARGTDNVALIVLSHLHADHAGGLGDLAERPMIWSRAAASLLEAPLRQRLHAGVFAELVPEWVPRSSRYLEDCPVVDIGDRLPGFGAGFDLLGDGALIGVPLPGHARGQYGLLLRLRDGTDVFLVADAAWHIRNVTAGVDPKGILDHILDDVPAYHRTLGLLRRLHAARPSLRIVPSHCAASLRAWPDAPKG